MSKIMTWHVWKVTYLRRNVTIVCGVSYHILGSQISWDSKIWFWLQVESYISNWQFSKLRHSARYVSPHNAMAYDKALPKVIRHQAPIPIIFQSRILQVTPEVLPKFNIHQVTPEALPKGIRLQAPIPIILQSRILQVTPEALPKFNIHQVMPQVTPEALPKFNILQITPEAIPKFNILQVTPEALPKFNMWTELMTGGLVPIWPQISTILQVTPEALPKFHMRMVKVVEPIMVKDSIFAMG